MLSNKQVEIADFLLKYLESKEGRSSVDDYPIKLEKQGFDYEESWFVPDFLREHLGLIEFWGDARNWIALTPNGYTASKLGLKEYLLQIENERQLEIESKKATIEGVNTAKKQAQFSMWISIIALITTIILAIYSTKN